MRFRLPLLGAVLGLLVAAGGAPSAERTPHIAGGTAVTDAAEAPWSVLLQRRDEDTGAFRTFCTANVVDATTVLTAAHCLSTGREYNDASEYRIQAGGTREDQPGAQVVEAVDVDLHPYFRSFRSGYDVGALRLARPLDLSTPAVQPIAIAREGTRVRTGKPLTFHGWGITESGRPQGLRSMRTRAIPTALCAPGLPATMCAFDRRRAPCGGDSGGGLIRTGTDGRPELVGLDSYGSDQCRPGQPDGFADLTQPTLSQWVTSRLAGEATLPFAAPRATRAPRVERVDATGARLRCAGAVWRANPTVTTTWLYASGKVIRRTRSNVYRARQRDVGESIYCTRDAVNRGGWASVASRRGYRFSFIP